PVRNPPSPRHRQRHRRARLGRRHARDVHAHRLHRRTCDPAHSGAFPRCRPGRSAGMSDRATTQNMGATERTRDRSTASNNPIYSLIEGRYWAYLLLIPSLILVLAVVVYPVLSGIWLSFHEYR